MPDYPGFVGGSYISKSQNALNARTMNFYVEPIELQGGQVRAALYPTPGVTSLATGTTSPGRAHFYQDGREFAVIGHQFVEIDSAGAITVRGTVAVDSNPATICSNGDGGGQIFVTSGDKGYIFNLSTGVFSTVRTSATTMGAHLDGFFLALDAATSTVFLSDLLDGTTWDPTQFIQRSIASDPWVAIRQWDRYLWFFGTQTSEVWYNAGTSPIPFLAHPSGLVATGIAAPFSAQIVGGSLMWLAQTANGRGDVVRTSGFTPEVVSTFALHAQADDFVDVSSAIGDTYEQLGHAFYVLTFPRSGTFVYDASPTLNLPSAMRWTERGTWISENNEYIAWRPLWHAFAFNEHRILDRDSGALYKFTFDSLYDVESRPLRRMRRPPALWARDQRLRVSEFEAVIEPGLGLVSGQGSDPQMALRISTNGGKVFGNERNRSAGALGDYSARAYWTRCGSAPQGGGWQPELVMTDPIPYRLLGARYRVAGQTARAA